MPLDGLNVAFLYWQNVHEVIENSDATSSPGAANLTYSECVLVDFVFHLFFQIP